MIACSAFLWPFTVLGVFAFAMVVKGFILARRIIKTPSRPDLG